jgi:hypothetical protein
MITRSRETGKIRWRTSRKETEEFRRDRIVTGTGAIFPAPA